MSLDEWLARCDAEREARTRRERHGSSVLILLDGVLVRASDCLLPDGTLTDAECLLPHLQAADTQRVWTRRLPGTVLRRRGRLRVEPGAALHFVDEPAADVVAEATPPVVPSPDLERDLGQSPRMRSLTRSELFATLLYGSLCNTTWRHMATGATWSCSWRHAGGIVAMLRGEGDYLDWYCSMGEGLVDEQVLTELKALGWELVTAEPPED